MTLDAILVSGKCNLPDKNIRNNDVRRPCLSTGHDLVARFKLLLVPGWLSVTLCHSS